MTPTGKAKYTMKMTPETLRDVSSFFELGLDPSQAKEIKLDPSGRPIFTEANYYPCGSGVDVSVDGIKNKLKANSTMDRTLVMAKFMRWAIVVQSASRVEDFELLADNGYDPLQQWVRGDCQNDGIGPDVQLCEQNRVDIETFFNDLHMRLDGKFLLCRTISRAVNGARLEAVVEDPTGKHAAILQLAYFTPTKYSLAVTGGAFGRENPWYEWLPQGSYIAVKNAFATVSGGAKSGAPAMICCKNPADVVLLSPKTLRAFFPALVWKGADTGASFWKNVGTTEAEIMKSLKRNGNTAFVFRRYTDALRWYDLAEEYAFGEGNASLISIWSNKAAAYLGLGCFRRALESCDQVLVLDQNHVKAIFRRVKALIGLGQSGEAAAFLKGILSANNSLMENEDLKGLGDRIPLLSYPETVTVTGKTHLTRDQFDKLKKAEIDFEPEYVGPIECRPASSVTCRRGGVFATEDIQPGQLVVSLRCFAHVMKATTGVMYKGLVDDELVGIIANKVAFSGDLGKDIYKLWAGKKLKFVDENEISLNLKVDIARIRKIVARNANFVDDGCIASISTIGAQIKHSCVDTNVEGTNFNTSFNASMLRCFRALKPIKKGEELVIRWCEPTEPLETRKLSLNKFGFTCNCRLCEYESRRDAATLLKFDTLCAKMKSIPGLDNEQRPMHKVSVNVILSIVAQLEEMYLDAPDLNMTLIDHSIRIVLCDALIALGLYKRLVTLCESIFVVAEAIVDSDMAIKAATDVMRGYLKLKMKKKAKEWFQKVEKWALAGKVLLTWSDLQIREMKKSGIDISHLLKDESQE